MAERQARMPNLHESASIRLEKATLETFILQMFAVIA